jgi:succinate dehydrogenase / fumarate reductase iron-sulfur subunit
MSTSLTTLFIKRTNGSYDSFQVERGDRTTLLDGLEEIYGRSDHTVLYRHSCHHGSCGTCSVIANGTPVLACLASLAELGEEVTVEPLSPFDVIGDLAVDPESLYHDLPHDASSLRPSEVNEKANPPREVDRYTRFENCIECGLCVSVCPVEGDFVGPAALAAYARELEKHPEREDELLPEIDSKRGVWGCERALNCSRICPLGVYPAKHIANLQRRIKGRDER